MFENRRQPLLGRRRFLRRQARYTLAAVLLVAGALCLGVAGYHLTEHLAFPDALLNASMILGGMGPVNPPHSLAGKLFASFYAIFSGVFFLIAFGVFAAPLIHRMFHAFHLDPPRRR